MPNIHTAISDLTLLKQQLVSLAEEFKRAQQAGELQTLEAIASQGMTLLGSLQRRLGNSPVFERVSKIRNTLPSHLVNNTGLNEVDQDLDILCGQFEALESQILTNWNFMVTAANRLRTRAQRVDGKIADLQLYVSNAKRDAIYLTNRFTNLEWVDLDSSLLSTDQCELQSEEGIATLPIDASAQQISVTQTPLIGAQSNGVLGNNQELGVTNPRNDLTSVLDGDPDTWFEYELVTLQQNDPGRALTLELLLTLDRIEIVNFIRINPNHFGTQSQVEILAIETSEDGVQYLNIKEDAAFSSLADSEREQLFRLAPNTNHYAGQALYSFTPRKAKFCRFKFRQNTSYSIDTPSGPRLRYAIGLRDIEIGSRIFSGEGEIISQAISSADEIKKLSLETSQFPEATSPLVSIDHSISIDEGQTWLPIRSRGSVGQSGILSNIPEVLSFNTGDIGSQATSSPVLSLKHKVALTRNDEAFSIPGVGAMQGTRATVSELLAIPSTSSNPLRLQSVPIDGTVRVLDPRVGTRGRRHQAYRIAAGIPGASERASTFVLPFKQIPYEYSKNTSQELVETNPVRVFVDGVEWEPGNIDTATSPQPQTVFAADLERGELHFGGCAPSESPGGFAPRGTVTVELEEERLYPNQDGIASLKLPISGDKNSFELYVVRPDTVESITLQRGAKIHRLRPDIIDGTISFSDNTVFALGPPTQEKTYINGQIELTAPGDWSVNLQEGIAYSFSTTDFDEDTICQFRCQNREELDSSAFELAWDGSEDQVYINQGLFESFPVSYESVTPTTPTTRRYSLAQVAIVPGSVAFTGGSGTIFAEEVPFENGVSEFAIAVCAKMQLPNLTTGLNTITVVPAISDDTNLGIAFSRSSDLFMTDVGAGVPDEEGEYSINRTTSVISVFTTAPSLTPGTMRFYYDSPTKTSANTAGKYSIDYEKGIIYTASSLTSGWYVHYRYTDYRARYDISRRLEPQFISVNVAEKGVYVASSELLLSHRIPALSGADPRVYNVIYETIRDIQHDVSGLAAYFTPVLRSVAFKVVTASRMILP